ncbi:unnamed protein product, partial [Symbiodinium pilosum]
SGRPTSKRPQHRARVSRMPSTTPCSRHWIKYMHRSSKQIKGLPTLLRWLDEWLTLYSSAASC